MPDHRDDWPHPDRCPSSACRGAFFFVRDYGIICTAKLHEAAGYADSEAALLLAAMRLSEEGRIERCEGLGLA